MVLVRNKQNASPNHQTSTSSNINLPAEVIYNRSSSVSAAAFRSKVPKSFKLMRKEEEGERHNPFSNEIVTSQRSSPVFV